MQSLLDPSNIVLDVCGSTAAFAFMTDDKVTVIDDGAVGQRVVSKPWRDSVFHTLTEFDTATFLFSLEYVENPRQF